MSVFIKTTGVGTVTNPIDTSIKRIAYSNEPHPAGKLHHLSVEFNSGRLMGVDRITAKEDGVQYEAAGVAEMFRQIADGLSNAHKPLNGDAA